MFDIQDEINKYTAHSSIHAEYVMEEIEVICSNHNMVKVDLELLDLYLLADNFTNITNKLIMEFCFYIIYLNIDNENDIIELFDEFRNTNSDDINIAIPIDMRFKIINKIKQVKTHMNRLTNKLLFIGWMENNKNDYSGCFLTGYEDGQM